MEMQIQLAHCQYPILIQPGLLKSFGETASCFGKRKLAIVTDENVWRLHGEVLKKQLSEFELHLTVLPPGEETKSPNNLMHLYQQWVAFGLTRSDLVVAYGGGVIGDLTGYAAATYLRGVPFIQMPTTLLSQIDSSIGGKVAVNLPEGKNLVGTFYHPQNVYIDPCFLETLEIHTLRDGIAEAIKSGCISDKGLVEILENTDLPLTEDRAVEIIQRSLKVKKKLVEMDEREMGLRKLLNYGHTLGHALETYGNYARWTHGEAVAIGMIAVTKTTEVLGLTEKGTVKRLTQLHQKLGLPYECPVDLNELIPLMLRDKKKASGKLDLAVIETLGEGYILPVSLLELYEFYHKGAHYE